MKIRNYDYLQYREKIVDEIYNGSSVFDCIPCCIQPSNTLLIDALFIETLLNPNSSLANLSGLFELKKRLKKQFRNKTIEILPIFERAYIDKHCQQLILIQFQDIMDDADDEQAYLQNNSQNGDNTNCALTLYHVWKQQIQQINSGIHNGNKLRIEFIEKWFANAYFLQHSHLWSDIALTSVITIYDNNNRYIPHINNKARHCRCSYKRIIYFPPFNPRAGDLSYNHDTQCVNNCCCCTYHHDGNEDLSSDHYRIHNGDVVLWHGRKCIAESKVDGSDQDYRIQIDGVNGKYVVALSSLQIVRKYKNLQNNQMMKVHDLKNLNSQIFDSQKHIWDDMSFVLYIKKFWNISTQYVQ